MISIDLYRQRIGRFNSNKYSVKKQLYPSDKNKSQNSKLYILLCILLLSTCGIETSARHSKSTNYNSGTSATYSLETSAINGTSVSYVNRTSVTYGTSARMSVYENDLYASNHKCSYMNTYHPTIWNKLMHITNGNIRSYITMGHWNGGPSYLGNSLRGNDKLESIKEILSNNELDILGISESNIESNTIILK